ncbi:MAG: segregation/condensation protein A, partial [Acidiphilium sp.]|nr:segregation/condensation protein A [Acidiphilium sp.]
AALSSTLIASLELARNGVLTLRQDQDFAPILLRATEAAPRSLHPTPTPAS